MDAWTMINIKSSYDTTMGDFFYFFQANVRTSSDTLLHDLDLL